MSDIKTKPGLALASIADPAVRAALERIAQYVLEMPPPQLPAWANNNEIVYYNQKLGQYAMIPKCPGPGYRLTVDFANRWVWDNAKRGTVADVGTPDELKTAGAGVIVKITSNAAGGGKYLGSIVDGACTAVAAGDEAQPEGMTVHAADTVLVINTSEDGQATHALTLNTFYIGKVVSPGIVEITSADVKVAIESGEPSAYLKDLWADFNVTPLYDSAADVLVEIERTGSAGSKKLRAFINSALVNSTELDLVPQIRVNSGNVEVSMLKVKLAVVSGVIGLVAGDRGAWTGIVGCPPP